MADGYVYVLTNEGMPGALKIGSTTRNPFTRAKELQTTGVPHPFVVVAAVRVRNASAVEKAVHRELARRDLRINGDREFFSADLAAVLGVMATLCAEGNEVGGGAVEARTGEDALLDAIAFRDGVGNQPPDMKKALLAFEEAAALGNRHADYVLMQLYSGGHEVRKSASKMFFYKRKVDNHISELSSDVDGILELSQMYLNPSPDSKSGRDAYELAVKTMFKHKHYNAGLKMIEIIIEKYGYEQSLLNEINQVAYLLDDKTKKIIEKKILEWVSLNDVCNSLILRINHIIENRSVFSNYPKVCPFSLEAMTFKNFDARSMFGYKFYNLMSGLILWDYPQIASRPKIEGEGLTVLGKWMFGDQYIE